MCQVLSLRGKEGKGIEWFTGVPLRYMLAILTQ